jgi:hypothetical protein
MKKLLSISALLYLTLPKLTFAVVCPVCTIAVGAGLGLAEWLGIDDSISGLWIGALIVAISIWTINWLRVRLWGAPATSLSEGKSRTSTKKIFILSFLTFAAYYLIIVGSLWKKGFINKNPLNVICGMDKLLFGVILGSVLFSAAVITLNILLKKNDGKSYFKGQKIALPIGILLVASIILYYSC